MAFTVNRKDGITNDADFEYSLRLLLRQGVDLGNAPRIADPVAGRRWLYVWDSEEQAQSFADALNKRPGDNPWVVLPIDAPVLRGPMGPVIIQVGTRGDRLVSGLHSLSEAMIQSAFPNAKPAANYLTVDFDTLQEFRATHGGLREWAREITPTLTGLNLAELERVGYALIEEDTHRTLVSVAPGDMDQSSNCSGTDAGVEASGGRISQPSR